MSKTPHLFFNVLAMTASVVVGVALAQDFEITRSTVDGGGVMRSTKGGFELSGTIGQPVAGPTLGMAGGGYTLYGGFWFPLVPDDCNSDGSVDLLDYSGFKACLAGPQGGLIDATCACYDRDGNGQVDVRDFGDFQSFLQFP